MVKRLFVNISLLKIKAKVKVKIQFFNFIKCNNIMPIIINYWIKHYEVEIIVHSKTEEVLHSKDWGNTIKEW